ncbi:hypothetical protein P186_0044 [Pyrobaculum ferrireducens]|uniref:Uncharacterized protein n=2 Tax=Pyrobaculum ferrireducens TaxID=1104324 RepID=G7VDT1_9CREN|nr:hypothetical protein P186_0044 [Pyrobaculum ferrireducens]
MVSGFTNTKVNIKIYRSRFNSSKCMIKIKYRKTIMKVMLCNLAKTYIKKLFDKNFTRKIKIVDIEGMYIKIDSKLWASGWLYFPHSRKLIGAVFYGDRGVVASPRLPEEYAVFIPLDAPIINLLDADVADFY